MPPAEIERHDSTPLATTTLIATCADGVTLSRTAPLGDSAAVSAAERELGEMRQLHDSAVLASWEILVQRTIDELREEPARPAHPRCIEHDCPVRILHVTGRAEGRSVSASALLDGSPEDHARRLDLLRSVALTVLEERGVTIRNHRHLYDDMGFETLTRA